MKLHRGLAVLMLMSMVACAGTPDTPRPATATALPAPTRTPAPTVVIALSPLTSDQAQKTSGAFLAEQLSKLTGFNIIVTRPRNYATLIQAMGENTVQVGWLPPFAYISAHQQGYANAGLATLQAGASRRGVQFMVNADWLITNTLSVTQPLSPTATLTPTIEPSVTATPIAKDDLLALRQLAGKRPCWVVPTSASGYLVPLGILNLAGITPTVGTFVNTNSEVVRALYNSPAGERCEFGATFIDARQGMNLPDLDERVLVVYVSAPVIPFDTVAYADALPAAQRETLTTALLTLARTEAGQRALKDVYDVDGLTRSDDTFYNAFRLYIEAAGVDPAELIE